MTVLTTGGQHSPATQTGHDQNSAETKPEASKNPIEHIFDRMFTVGFGRWLISMVVLGLAAGIVSKRPVGGLRAAAIYNIAIGCLHFFLPGPIATGRAATDPRPPMWYYIVLTLSTIAWLSAFPLIFAFSDPEDDAYVIFEVSPDNDKRRRGLFGLSLSAGQSTLAVLENISLACGAMGVCCFIFCVYQWYGLYKLATTQWTPEQLAEAWTAWEAERGTRKLKEEEKKMRKAVKQTQAAPG
ncbi:hypothetical protein Micbo1qcDRAFT_204733 [Microdochium bolleyi]|uniref:Uncharacterized protein n=1 Tax=Microdochium bolleyi TaxID=196109 RepID=A0A136J3G1_9PEZI|nr:hypothetical protein Micbo1qcDRAFT_204733 [Microdochium bolleyi]